MQIIDSNEILMKKFLPKSFNNPQGFTLIELLVVVSIIAILSAIGIALYTGIQPKARNDRRRADLDAIAKALEINKTSAGYVVLDNTQFANGVTPLLDPQGYVYCGNTTANVQGPGLTSASTASTCTPSGANNYSPIAAGSIPPAGTSWKICTWLEAETSPTVAAGSYCKGNAQ